MRKSQYFIVALCLTFSLGVQAQKMERKSVRQGNKLYEKKKFTEAEVAYRKALEVNPHSTTGSYNLGNALYKQEKGKEALQQYQLAISREKDPLNKAAIMHNTGNTYMQAKDYENAVSSYKASMRSNPGDNETRYNLAMAQALLKRQQQKNKDKKDNKKDQKQDQQDQQKQQQKQDQDKKQNKQQQQQKQQGQEQITKEKAQQMLNALSQDEKETQEKVSRLKKQRGKSNKTDKDW